MRLSVLILASSITLALAACKPAAAPADTPVAPPAAAAPTVAAPTTDAVAMRAFGNEPFWEMIDDGKGALVFTTPDTVEAGGKRFDATRSADAAGIHYVGKDVKLDIVKQGCSDGMSDATHPYSATMTLEGRSYSGCAAPAADVMPMENETAAALAAADADKGPVSGFSANGFSPAWRAEVAGDTVKLDVPEHARVDPGFTTVTAKRGAYAKGVEFSGKDAGTDFVLTIDGRTRCDKAGDANGKTDREFNATLTYGKTSYRGCADAVK